MTQRSWKHHSHGRSTKGVTKVSEFNTGSPIFDDGYATLAMKGSNMFVQILLVILIGVYFIRTTWFFWEAYSAH